MSASNAGGKVIGQSAGEPRDPAEPARRTVRGFTLTPTTVVIVAGTLMALVLRAYQMSRPGILTGITEYDDGNYFGSAVRLVNGSLPYRDFLIVQPPGITVLMLPAALLSKVTGTAAGMVTGRVLTALASIAAVALAGLLVRHRGIFATVVVCGISAVYPDSIGAAHAVLVEPWLVLFCLIGALAVFDGDRLTTSVRRLAWGGAAFGFAGAVEAWAIVPVIVLVIVMLAVRLPRLTSYLAGVAVGFGIPVLPFAIISPSGLYQGVITAQIGSRVHPVRVPIWQRLKDLTGLANTRGTSHFSLLAAGLLIVGVVVACLLLAYLSDRRPPPALEAFAVGSFALVIVMFMWPNQFHYHFGAFLAPFLALALALPASRLLPPASRFLLGTRPAPDGGQAVSPVLTWCAAGLAALAVITMAVLQGNWEATTGPKVPVYLIPAAERLIPPGACVLTDEVSQTIMANRFNSNVPGCPLLLDSTGTDFALSHGRLPGTGAAKSPALAAVWRNAFSHAQYVWFSFKALHRIPWPAGLMAYFRSHFVRILAVTWGRSHPATSMAGIYRRIGLRPGQP